MAGLLAIFSEFEREILREGSVRAWPSLGRTGRPATAALHADVVRKLYRAGRRKSEIARHLKIGRTWVRRILAKKP
jgi:putative DNA-invertase from lambdoid prophage Rac